jgi:hypothetical protein
MPPKRQLFSTKHSLVNKKIRRIRFLQGFEEVQDKNCYPEMKFIMYAVERVFLLT